MDTESKTVFLPNSLPTTLCVPCQDGWSSLMAASLNGHVEVVDKLLQHGATVDLENKVRSP